LANSLTIKKLKTCIGNKAVDLVGRSKMPDVIDSLDQERFDVILIDSLSEEAGYFGCSEPGNPVWLSHSLGKNEPHC